MHTFDAIFSRRTIRSYNGKAPEAAQLQQILKAAWASPVGRARFDTLHLTVITNPDFLARWEETAAPGNHPLYGAPVVILVSSAPIEETLINVNYSNAAIVTENMALAATDLGLGACHIWGIVNTLRQNAALLQELNLPEGFIPCCALALGQTDEIYTLREIPEEKIATSWLK